MTAIATTTTAIATAPQLLLEFTGGFPAPLAADLKHQNTSLLEQYLNTWTSQFGEPNHQETGDFEHFVENMARFDAAWRAFGSQNTMINHRSSEHVSTLRHFNGNPVLPGTEASVPGPDFVFGPVASWGPSHHGEPDNGSADKYWDIPAFKELSGRSWTLAGFYPDDQNEPELLQVIQSMFDDGVRRFVIKGTASKTMLEKFTLTVRPTSLYGHDCEIPSEVTDGVMHREGDSKVFLVQEYIPMVHEYRFFMAGNQPASGAGCIEHFTPLDSKDAAFDGRTEGKRGSGAVAEYQDVVDRLLAFARQAGALLHQQAPDLGAAWVMDLAINEDTDEIVVIELNPARNAGLYASNPGSWMGAVRDWIATS